MNIQISVIIWTVICFFLVMLILRNLLFRPMLAMMDKRAKRIADAKEKQKADEIKEKDAIAAMEKSVIEQNEQAKADAERKITEEKISAEQELEELQNKEQEACDAYRAELEAEKESLNAQISKEVKRLGEIFVSGFIS